MKRHLAALAIAALLAPAGRVAAAPVDTIPVIAWFGVGTGMTTGAGEQTMEAVGVAIGRWGIRASFGYGEGDPWHEFQEYAATYGVTRRRGRQFVAVRAGISVGRWDQFTYSLLDDPILVGKETVVGAPIEAQVAWRIARSFSLGFIAVGNVNRLHSVAGLLAAASYHFR